MKKLLCLALAAMLCLALAACAVAEGNWKIAILTGTTSQGEEEFRAAERAQKADPEHIVTDTYPDNFMAETETTISKLIAFASDPDVKAIVMCQAVPGAKAAFDKIRAMGRDDMLLMLDYGNFFEFRSGGTIVPLEGVECGRVYAMLITSNNGLWRYEIGDTVEFTSTNPYRIRFAGRTRQYINVFGEELIVDNADRALIAASNETGAVVGEYTVAPCYMSLRERGAHEWIVEFDREPESAERFAGALDEALRAVNSDYDAKRRTTLERQRIVTVPRGYFLRWMRARGKNKVPRLVNDRRVADEILAFQTEQTL